MSRPGLRAGAGPDALPGYHSEGRQINVCQEKETSMSTVYQNYIGGKWVNAVGGQTFESCNPARTNEVIGIFQRSGAEDVDAAIQAAHGALPAWRSTPAPLRADIILETGLLLAKHKEELAQLETREMGKVLEEGRGDVQEGIDMAKYIAGEGRRMFGETVPSELRRKFAMGVRQPIGVCGLITPWNFPIAIPTWKLFPALVAGNTVVFKPAEDTPAA